MIRYLKGGAYVSIVSRFWGLLIAISFVLTLVTASIVTSNFVTYADGAGSPVECNGDPNVNPNAANVNSSIGGDANILSNDVGGEKVVTGVCIRSGSTHSGILGNGTFNIDGAPGSCYLVAGVGTQVVTVTRVGNPGPSCQDLSHIDVIFAQVQEPEEDEESIMGQISGLVYHDVDNNSEFDGVDQPLENKTVWLLTHNSPWILKSITTTDNNGEFLFENLTVPSTYYVCQDVESGWFQTQLNQAGLGGLDIGSATEGDVIGDSPELDAIIAEFCYEVELTVEEPIVTQRNFGNYQEPEDEPEDEPGQVLGSSTTNNPDSPTTPNESGVLGASTLASTGQSPIAALIFGLVAITVALALIFTTKLSSQKINQTKINSIAI